MENYQIDMEEKPNGISDVTDLVKSSILSAVKKQVPQKPYYRVEEYAEGWACPVCDMGVTIDHGRTRNSYCSNCGQAIDWKDV